MVFGDCRHDPVDGDNLVVAQLVIRTVEEFGVKGLSQPVAL